jgi:hypothetical protein
MNREAQILTALQGNITSEAKRALVDELNTIRAKASRRVAVAREVELGKEAASAHLTPAQPYVRHTTETDWLGKVASTRHTASEIHQMAKAEASRWFRQTSALARADVSELNIQAVGYAQVWSGQFGEALHVAQSSFLQAASHLAGVKLSADNPFQWAVNSTKSASKRTASISMDDIQRWCDRNGCVMKDFPDELIEEVANSGDLEQLGSYLDDIEAAEIGQYDNDDFRHSPDHDGFYGSRKSLGVDWFMPGKKRPFATSTRATSDLIVALGEDGHTVQSAHDAILYDPEGKAILAAFIAEGYVNTPLIDLVGGGMVQDQVRKASLAKTAAHHVDEMGMSVSRDHEAEPLMMGGRPVRKGSSKTAASPDFTSYPKGRAPGQEWSTTCSVCGGTETGTDYYNGWPSQNAFHNHLLCGHDPDADYHQDLAIDRYSSLRTAATPTGRSDYKPGMSRVGEPTPQSDPDMFSSEDLLAEAKYLLKMNEKYGSHELRTMAVTKLIRIITDRGDVERLTPKSRKKAEADGIDSPSPDSQNGYAESTLPDVSVPSAPEDTNMGWIAEGDPNAVTGSMGVYEAMFMRSAADQVTSGPLYDAAGKDASLGVGHIWTNTSCPAYKSYDPKDCICSTKSASRTAAQEGWWPLVPDDRYPGENKLVCPACGSADVSISGNNLGRDIITNNLYTSLTCNSCGRRDILPEKPKDLRGASRKQAVGTSYYAIADDGPDNEMHEFAPGSADRTACGKHTGWCRAFPPSDAIYCPSCFGHEASRKHAEANGIDSPSPQSQNGYAETTLTDVSVGSAPDDTNLGWITDGDPNAEDESAFDSPDNPIANEASINARFARLMTAGWSYDIFVPEMGTSMTEDGFASLEEADAAAKRAAGQYAGASGFLNDAGGNAYSWTSRSASRRTAGENDRPAGAAPMVDQVTDDPEDDTDMFGGEWVHGYLDDAPNLLGDPPGMDPEDYDMFAPEASVKTAMPAPADVGVSVGSIFYSSWGYDQTNVSFYEVVGLTPASVKVREVAKSFVSQNGPGGNKVIPQPGNYIGGEMTKRLQNSGYRDAAITINSSETAWLWDGKPQYETDSMYGH